MLNEKSKRNISILLGDPRKAIIKLSLPIIVGSMVQTLYNFVDGVWVAGVGSDSLGAVGLFMPFMLILSSLAMGIGVGGSSAISRAIGSGNRKRAGNVAEHTLIVGTLIGTAIAFAILPFLKGIFLAMGASERISELAYSYGTVIILGSPLMFISSLGNAILRGEGDTRRAMYIMLTSSLINMFLDPVFIFTLGMGVVGAAVATVISIAVSAAFITYWLTVKRDTYVQLRLKYFKRDFEILREIFSVGFPSALAQISMAFTMLVLNTIVIMVGGDYGISVFSGGWRIVMLAIVPLMGIAAAVTSVTGAAYGARNSYNLRISYLYGVKIGTLIGLVTGILIWIFAPQLAYLFTYTEQSSYLAGGIIEFLRYMVIYFPAVASGMLTSSMFRGIGRGLNSLLITIIRALVMQIIFAYFFGIFLGFGLAGVWMGIVIANLIASSFAILWGVHTVNSLARSWEIKS